MSDLFTANKNTIFSTTNLSTPNNGRLLKINIRNTLQLVYVIQRQKNCFRKKNEIYRFEIKSLQEKLYVYNPQ